MLESEIQEAQRKIENNKRSIHILKIAEIARNGENISAPSTLVNENRAITIEQPPIPITQNP
jgi:hypothetical protein